MGLVVETMPTIGITRISRWSFTCYLIHDAGGGPLVVDAGLPGVADDLIPVMADDGHKLSDLAGIVATHGHSDHVGGAPMLSSRSGAAVHLPCADRAYLDGAIPSTPSVAAVARIWPTIFDQPFDLHGGFGAVRGTKVAGYGTGAQMRWPTERSVEFLAEGDNLPGAPEWQVMATPGHTDDSTAFWHPRTRTLLSGDAVLTVGGRAWITPETVDDPVSTETAARLGALDVAHLLPGHGRPVHGEAVMAGALGPGAGPGGFIPFWTSLVRCLAGRPSD
jgi:glyoxylase-like metal-dependent hydrolase (beta-lactamase superfamily II)